jgi:hypothetical protein
MVQMITTTAARFEAVCKNGERLEVAAWSDTGQALVVDEAMASLIPATDLEGFQRIGKLDVLVPTAARFTACYDVPAEVEGAEDKTTFKEVAAWNANGDALIVNNGHLVLAVGVTGFSTIIAVRS